MPSPQVVLLPAPPVAALLDSDDPHGLADLGGRGGHRMTGPSDAGRRGRRRSASATMPSPTMLRHDPEPPAVLFVRGDLDLLDGRRAGIVGTRNATQSGREMAASLGRAPRRGGRRRRVRAGQGDRRRGAPWRVAGHRTGAPSPSWATAPIEPYPRQHAALWAEVCERGLLLSEWPPGTAPEPFRFPMRNRILAALSEVLVVVESRERGGSLITARAAMERDVEVMAVPGSVRNRAAVGTNQLLRDGAAPVTDVGDVLVALGLDTRRAGRADYDPRPLPRGDEATVFETAAATRGRSTTSSPASACRSARRRWRWPGSSARVGSARRAGGSKRWCHGPTRA